MNIEKIFCQSLGVTSHVKTFLMVCHFQTDSCSNEFGIRLITARVIHSEKKKCHPFKWLGLSVQKKNVICLNGLCYLLERLERSV